MEGQGTAVRGYATEVDRFLGDSDHFPCKYNSQCHMETQGGP